MSFGGDEWTLLREDPDFHQRMVMRLADDRLEWRADASEDEGQRPGVRTSTTSSPGPALVESAQFAASCRRRHPPWDGPEPDMVGRARGRWPCLRSRPPATVADGSEYDLLDRRYTMSWISLPMQREPATSPGIGGVTNAVPSPRLKGSAYSQSLSWPSAIRHPSWAELLGTAPTEPEAAPQGPARPAPRRLVPISGVATRERLQRLRRGQQDTLELLWAAPPRPS